MRVNGKLLVCAVILLLSAQVLVAQQDRKTQTSDEVLRISTELVQTGVTVFDKQGRFVDGLAKEDFESCRLTVARFRSRSSRVLSREAREIDQPG